ARFRRRELLRIFLRDIRRLATIAEITEEISNLADAILENSLRVARQELDNRFGSPLDIDSKGRQRPSDICIVSLGKLGSKELNYSSDIDLLFIYSAEGTTTGGGSRDAITNREYFVKLVESVTKLVGRQTGEGAAYRVDLRLRPHGRVGSLALSLKETIRYYTTEARSWERQVLIRSRSSAGNSRIFKGFFNAVEDSVFSASENVESALRAVYRSKEQIDFEHKADKEFDVKLGRGGIREIEFVAQALQLAHAGNDKWLRATHTLISLSRLADRGLLSESELTGLFEAYDFLRHLEHILQMENGLQTHSLPNDPTKRLLVAKRMRLGKLSGFERALKLHTGHVHDTFVRVFGEKAVTVDKQNYCLDKSSDRAAETADAHPNALQTQILSSFEKMEVKPVLTPERQFIIRTIAETSIKFGDLLTAKPNLIETIEMPGETFPARDYPNIFLGKLADAPDFGTALSRMRTTWSQLLVEIAVYDILQKIPVAEIKRLQTKLAEASIEAALRTARHELSQRFAVEINALPIGVLALGKLGGGSVDYDSDLDLVLVYDDEKPLLASGGTHAQFYGRAVETFVTALSSMTRDGNLYRVDLRLRPYGKNGAGAISRNNFLEYMRNTAAIWELLAFVKIRAVGGDPDLARATEKEIREVIHDRAVGENAEELRNVTMNVRMRLQDEKTAGRKGKDVDIKFGSGGMLDVYFAVRYLQLRDNLQDDTESRSTAFMLQKLFEKNSLSEEDYKSLSDGYAFLSALDHSLRLAIGRSTRLPQGHQPAMQMLTTRMGLKSPAELLESLTFHRLNIRTAFESILS
ncbi:MAG: hypothetical protein ABIU09_10660, partial [Pyrinomonadaceae bacterium]